MIDNIVQLVAALVLHWSNFTCGQPRLHCKCISPVSVMLMH